VQEPYTDQQALGRKIYIEYGCIYCHSQQVRDPVAGADESFGWGRPSVPSDYIYDQPHLMGTSRTGPDLSNVGSRQPSKEWHHLHLYDPRLLVDWSIMPRHAFLYQKTKGEKPADNALKVPETEDEWIIPSEEADALVAYLLALKRDAEPPDPAGEKRDE
ncbi:MAG: cbb3-type cytochrome c oxidase subunit II, partial [Candidatus Eremiobacteraeota bacterium]|nr:cbb3-type cytochrome c oxidase subunit II [Candidatus Eremiobacteraeota bacterium]